MSSDLYENADVMNSLLRAICDPGSITDREPDESIQAWERRAVIEHAAPYIEHAARQRLLSVRLERFGDTIEGYLDAEKHRPEDRWDRGYQCGMRQVAKLLADPEAYADTLGAARTGDAS